MKTSLVVLSAGMGSRFGGFKQLQPITPDGRVLLDFSIEDALSVGFDEVVFVIRKDMEKAFKSTLGARTEQKCPVKYVYQDMPIAGRTKPLGTCHALLCCKDVVQNNFAVVNCDDYYGVTALKTIHDFLIIETNQSAMVAYQLGNTLSNNGTVSRGLCTLSGKFLQTVREVKNIDANCVANGQQLAKTDLVSMNLWGFCPSIFPLLQRQFDDFLHNCDLHKDEMEISTVINTLIDSNQLQVKVFQTEDNWVGMTYRQDLPMVCDFLKNRKI